MNAIEIKNLTKDYGSGKGIFGIDFSVQKGEVFGFLGPNGAGKTTTIRHLMGFIKAQTGTCQILGKDCFQDAPIIQENLGFIPGELSIIDDMTGMEFIQFIANLKSLKNLNRAQELISLFELNPKGKIKKMSKGMKQKIGIVCAFMHQPDLYILDEPTSGLDPLMQNRFVQLILEEKKRGATILMSSHMFEEVEKTCDRIGIIKDGKMMTIDTTQNLKQSKIRYYKITFSNITDLNRFLAEGFTIHNQQDLEITISIQSDLNKLLSILRKYDIVDLDVIHQTLEEIFMHYYGKEVL